MDGADIWGYTGKGRGLIFLRKGRERGRREGNRTEVFLSSLEIARISAVDERILSKKTTRPRISAHRIVYLFRTTTTTRKLYAEREERGKEKCICEQDLVAWGILRRATEEERS